MRRPALRLVTVPAAVLAAAGVLLGCAGGASVPSPSPSPAPASASDGAGATTGAWGTSSDAAHLELRLPGAFSEATTVAELAARFGAENVVTVRGTDAEGYPSATVVLFPDDPTRRAYLRFYDDVTLEGLASIEVRDRGSLWRGKLGVYVGMSFAELRALNAKPFAFWGFDGEGRGWAHDGWSLAVDGDDGALGAFDVSEGEHMYFDVALALRDPQAGRASADVPQDEYSVSSDDPRFPRLGELVEVVGFGASTSLDDEW